MGRREDFAASVDVEEAGGRAGEWNGEVDSTLVGGNLAWDEWKQRIWLQKVSMFAAMHDDNKTTYQGHPMLDITRVLAHIWLLT